jgi:hypothetical protein
MTWHREVIHCDGRPSRQREELHCEETLPLPQLEGIPLHGERSRERERGREMRDMRESERESETLLCFISLSLFFSSCVCVCVSWYAFLSPLCCEGVQFSLPPSLPLSPSLLFSLIFNCRDESAIMAVKDAVEFLADGILCVREEERERDRERERERERDASS